LPFNNTIHFTRFVETLPLYEGVFDNENYEGSEEMLLTTEEGLQKTFDSFRDYVLTQHQQAQRSAEVPVKSNGISTCA